MKSCGNGRAARACIESTAGPDPCHSLAIAGSTPSAAGGYSLMNFDGGSGLCWAIHPRGKHIAFQKKIPDRVPFQSRASHCRFPQYGAVQDSLLDAWERSPYLGAAGQCSAVRLPNDPTVPDRNRDFVGESWRAGRCPVFRRNRPVELMLVRFFQLDTCFRAPRSDMRSVATIRQHFEVRAAVASPAAWPVFRISAIRRRVVNESW